jgi:pimeloyl-ACP methyl ester carboxylesterase
MTAGMAAADTVPDEETAGDVIALIEELGGPSVVVGNSMGAGSAVLAAAQRPGLVLTGPFVRNGKTSAMQRLLLRMAMAPPWATISWRSYLPKLYAGQRPADFGEDRDQVVASLRRPGYAQAFSRTTRTSHNPAEARLADVTAPALVAMGEQDPDLPDPQAEADWIARARHAQVVMVPEAGHYPQSQQPGLTAAAVLRFLETVTGRA